MVRHATSVAARHHEHMMKQMHMSFHIPHPVSIASLHRDWIPKEGFVVGSTVAVDTRC